MSTILGIDPGSRFTGFGLIQQDGDHLYHIEHGVIEIPARLHFSDKLHFLSDRLDQLLDQHRPQHAAIERIFLGKNADSAFKLGHIRGICLLQAARYKAAVAEYAPRSVKKAVTGSGSASKDHVRLIVLNMLRLQSGARLDATDALSLAICHARKSAAQRLLKSMENQSP